jgi:predicted GNAT family acetyltransferase
VQQPRDESGTPEQFDVIDASALGRYELRREGELVGLADYSIDGDVLVVRHVETLQPHRGQGFAARLMAGIVDDADRRGLRIRPVCSYAAAYLRGQV